MTKPVYHKPNQEQVSSSSCLLFLILGHASYSNPPPTKQPRDSELGAELRRNRRGRKEGNEGVFGGPEMNGSGERRRILSSSVSYLALCGAV